MNCLQMAKQDCLNYALLLPKRYEEYDINELADGYCKAKDENDEYNLNIYLSALTLRWWYRIEKEYQKCKTAGVSREEVYAKMIQCIMAACDYRAWQDPSKNTNAQACINTLIASRCAAYIMYESNLQGNKFNRLMSLLDRPIDENDPDGDTFADQLGDEIEDVDNSKVLNLIQDYINENKIVEAIILDNIAFKDVFKHETEIVKEIGWDGEERKYQQQSSSFWPFKLVKELNALDEVYTDQFTQKYAVEIKTYTKALDYLKKATNSDKYRFIRNTIEDLKTTWEF